MEGDSHRFSLPNSVEVEHAVRLRSEVDNALLFVLIDHLVVGVQTVLGCPAHKGVAVAGIFVCFQGLCLVIDERLVGHFAVTAVGVKANLIVVRRPAGVERVIACHGNRGCRGYRCVGFDVRVLVQIPALKGVAGFGRGWQTPIHRAVLNRSATNRMIRLDIRNLLNRHILKLKHLAR